jgi:hypothetical protein
VVAESSCKQNCLKLARPGEAFRLDARSGSEYSLRHQVKGLSYKSYQVLHNWFFDVSKETIDADIEGIYFIGPVASDLPS